jgi:ribosomal-protein-alanine N-acetyltransferase
MEIRPLTLTGRYVTLSPLGEEHAEALAACSKPELFVYHFPPPEFTPAGFTALIHWLNSAPGYLPFAIQENASGRVVGVTCYLDIRPEHRGLEIGFTWVAKPVQRTAVNPDCKYLLLKHAFEVQNALRVQLKTDLRNVQSQRAIEKLGAVREGVLRKHMIRPDGYVRDTVMYSVTNDEWPAVRAGLERRLTSFD